MPSLIPRRIHQTWRNLDIPPHWEESRAAWKALHPHWEYILWTDEDLRNLVATRYPELLPYYDFYPHNIQRVDAARYLILDSMGGLYCDLDLVPLMTIDPFLETGCETYFALSTNVTSCLTNSIMASAPGAEIWRHVILELAKRSPPAWALTKHFAIMMSTGPMMLDRVFRRSAQGNIGILPPALFSNRANQAAGVAAIKTIRGSSWCSFDSEVFIFINNNRTLVTVIAVAIIAVFVVCAIVFGVKWGNSQKSLTACELARFECEVAPRKVRRARATATPR